MLFGCHTNVRTPDRSSTLRGSVLESSGVRQRVSVLVTVTNLAKRSNVAVLSTDFEGKFPIEMTAGQYAVAATSNTGFAFVEKIATPIQDLIIRLSSLCHRVQGTVIGGPTLSARVSLSRISRFTGDRFAVPIAADGRFAACLPEGTYSTQVEGSMVSLQGPIVVPSTKPIELMGFSNLLIEHLPEGVHIQNADFASFAKSLRGFRIVGLGEANHGTGEFYTYRGKLSLELARSGNLRSVLIEADAIRMMAIDDYVGGTDLDIGRAVAAVGFWITDIQEFLTFLAEARRYNASIPPARRIHVLGIDAQNIEPPIRLLLDHRVELSITESEVELLGRLVPNHGAAYSALSRNAATNLTSLLERLASPPGAPDLAGIETRASIAARSIRYQLGYVEKIGTGALRDQAMSELTAYIVGLYETDQATLWAHNGHIARQPDGASKSLGQHLSDRFGGLYYPVAFLSYRGEGRAWDEGGKVGVIPHALVPAPSYNLEAVIMRGTGFVDIAWVRLDTADGALKQWLSIPRYVREFGSAFHPGDTQTLRSFPAAMAGVVVIQHGSSSTPTPTGVRRVSK